NRSGRRWECPWPRTVRNSSSRRRIRSSRGRSRRSGCSHRFPSPAALTSRPAGSYSNRGSIVSFHRQESAVKIEHSTPASTSELGSEEKRALAVRSMMIMVDGDRSVFEEVVSADAVNHEEKDEPPAARAPGPEGFFATAL